MKLCTVPGCDRKSNCHGMCFMHYGRMKRNGTTDIQPPRPKGPLTAARLREVIEYTPETGTFTWRHKRGPRCGEAGAICSDTQYRRISVDSRLYLAHRLAWLYMTGSWPECAIDHKNGERADNRFENLRDVSLKENVQNRRLKSVNSSSGFLGVSVSENYKGALRFKASIMYEDKRIYIGRFATAEEASAAYFGAKKMIHKGFIPQAMHLGTSGNPTHVQQPLLP
jgi:hypothetical protein